MSGLFISYRRQDAAGHAGRLHDDLASRYQGRVFLDVASIAPGADFAAQMHDAVSSSEVMLVVIGPQWLSAPDASGRRRIDRADDFIRSEIAAALSEAKPVVPVLVGGAHMPAADALPHDVRGLVTTQAVVLRDDSWQQDVAQLSRVLDRLIRAPVSTPTASPQSAAQPTEELPITPLFARMAQAFDVLLGRTRRHDASAPERRASGAAAHVASPTATVAPQSPQRPHEIFVSYSTKDGALVDKIVRALEIRGRICWIAPRDIPPGSPS